MATNSVLSIGARRLEGKVALITGAASGIGECAARLFSKHGAKVMIADVQDELGQSVCNELNSTSASFVHCDVTKEPDIKNAVDATIAKYGKLDIMYNNAGIVGEPNPNILDISKEEFEQVVSVNLTGAFLGTKHAARVMIPARRGSIISTASVCSVICGASTHAYTSSKHAIVGLTKNTAVELGQHGIRVNCVSPYVVPTPLSKEFFKVGENGSFDIYANLKGAFLNPEDVAEAALYLGCDDSKYVSGLNLIIDGGISVVNAKFCMFGQSESK